MAQPVKPFVVDGHSTPFRYDGHGALSAGASSRLLFDYPEPSRSDILDLLFLPKFGGSLHHLKVEIGGDSQSTDGTEPSHMHERGDYSCERGYELWLLREARRRNPSIVTYVLSWAVPWWVGNQSGYYSGLDNIDYHIKFLQCTAKAVIGPIDYLGNWNERSWGDAAWTVKMRAALDLAGFSETRIIVPDGSWHQAAGILPAVRNGSSFASALKGGGIGLHYACDEEHPEVQRAGLKYWSSEDYSTVGDWAGAGCWGRLLNQNFVHMNMTSTIAWSLVWSVYPHFPFANNSLMYASEPWSGAYDLAGGALWTGAHTTQFTEVGWDILGGGTLTLGGSYVAYASTAASGVQRDVTIVVEKLEGVCLHPCRGGDTQQETIIFKMTHLALPFPSRLALWSTNRTHQFVHHGDALVSHDGLVSLRVDRDTIYTLSTTSGQQKGSPPVPPSAPFPSIHADDFDSSPIDSTARYFADDGGSFTIVADPTQRSQQPELAKERGPLAGAGQANRVLKQWVRHPAGVNQWVRVEMEPITLIGNSEVRDHQISVDVHLRSGDVDGAAYAGLCGRVAAPELDREVKVREGYCLLAWAIDERGQAGYWQLVKASGAAWTSLDEGPLNATRPWHTLQLRMRGSSLQATVDEGVGKLLTDTTHRDPGFASLNSGWGYAWFDNFRMTRLRTSHGTDY